MVDDICGGVIERLWYGDPGRRSFGVRALDAALRPVEALYRWGSRLHRARLAGRVVDPGCPVISVGNITVGGSGKSTVSLLLAGELASRGAKPALVAHGFRAGGTRTVTFSGRSGLPPVAEVGDEALMAAVRNPRLPVTVGPDKARSCLEAARMGAGVIILDDGFHRLDIPRALDLVVFDAARGVGNGACLPRGPLREPVSSLSRADLVVVFTSPGDAIPADLAALCREHCPAVPLLAGEKRPGAFLRWAGQGLGDPVDLAGRTVSAFCGLGNPGSFRRSLADAGGSVSRFEAFPDHHTYRPAELARLGRAGCEAGAAAVVTTLKDAVKIPHWPDEAPPLAVLTVDAVIADPDGQLGRRLDLVAGVGR